MVTDINECIEYYDKYCTAIIGSEVEKIDPDLAELDSNSTEYEETAISMLLYPFTLGVEGGGQADYCR